MPMESLKQIDNGDRRFSPDKASAVKFLGELFEMIKEHNSVELFEEVQSKLFGRRQCATHCCPCKCTGECYEEDSEGNVDELYKTVLKVDRKWAARLGLELNSRNEMEFQFKDRRHLSFKALESDDTVSAT